MEIKKISIVIPAYNEEKFIAELIKRVCSVEFRDLKGKPLEKELVIVDDCSKDGTRKILKNYQNKKGFKVILKEVNGGKGSALKTGFKHATGEIIVIQDADLEYDPNDLPELIRPILEGKYSVVYGSRFKSKKGNLKKSHLVYFVHSIGNFGLTMITNILFLSNLTDMETCYKAFRIEVLEKIGNIRSERFDFEPEITAKILKKGYKIKELPIHYYSRDFAQGKKITWKDGLKAMYSLIKFRFID